MLFLLEDLHLHARKASGELTPDGESEDAAADDPDRELAHEPALRRSRLHAVDHSTGRRRRARTRSVGDGVEASGPPFQRPPHAVRHPLETPNGPTASLCRIRFEHYRLLRRTRHRPIREVTDRRHARHEARTTG